MKIVIQCAASKRSEGFWRSSDGRRVKFVAHPAQAPSSESAELMLAHPDDPTEPGGPSWRDLVIEYNRRAQNPQALLPAYQLYTPPSYAALLKKFGEANIYVLSAGWGLIPASFLTPNYDITFSASADDHKRRKRADVYRDIRGLDDASTPVLFLGGKDYLPLFCKLTAHLNVPRFVYFNSASKPNAQGCHTIRYPTRRRTNWQYDCAKDLIDGTLALPTIG